MIAFTVSTNTYLAHAVTLAESFREHNPDVPFAVGLADRRHPDVDYSSLDGFELVEVEDLGIVEFDEMCQRYSVLELVTALKPFFLNYFMNRAAEGAVLYFDSDTDIHSSIQPILDEMGDGLGLLTPHSLTPLSADGRELLNCPFSEATFLACGIYNMGFIAVREAPGSQDFLDWWMARTAKWCYARNLPGAYVDQLWMNLAPLYFPEFRISRNPGLNVAYWNLHERRLSHAVDGSLLVNDTKPLVFFHFSSLDPDHPETITNSYDSGLSFAARPDLESLFQDYARRLLDNGYRTFSAMECALCRAAALPVDAAQIPHRGLLHRLARWCYGRTMSLLRSLHLPYGN